MDICIDSRVRSCWDLPYYVRHHMVGGCVVSSPLLGKLYLWPLLPFRGPTCWHHTLADRWCEHPIRFLNDAHGSELGTNAQYVTVDTTGYQHPYDGGRWVSKRVYLRATQDITAGGELLASYGTTYHGLHFKA